MPEKMMEEFECWLIRSLKFILTGILLLAYLLLVGQWISPEPRHSIIRLSEAERHRIGERHRSQGIDAGIIENGQRYFRYFCRDGEKYKLSLFNNSGFDYGNDYLTCYLLFNTGVQYLKREKTC